MDERIVSFLRSLKDNLKNIPEAEAAEALNYYEEYLCDALDDGKDLDQVIAQLGPLEKIGTSIKADIDIRRAEDNPGIKNFSRAMKTVRGIGTPFSVFFVSLFIIIAYCIVGTFMAGALVFILGAAATAMMAFYEAFKIPIRFFLEILGTVGAGLFSGGLCMVLAILFYRFAKVLIKLSARLIRRSFRRRRPVDIDEVQETPKKKKSRLLLAFSIASIIGLALFSVSGLPTRFFIMFNSMKPAIIDLAVQDFDPAGINKISIVSANSCIEVGYQDTDKDAITVSYEQPDWTDYDLSVNGSMLSFHEMSNGRLPFFSIDTLHESRTLIKVLLPEGYDPDMIHLESRGGYITVRGLDENVKAKTHKGKIYYFTQGQKINLDVFAGTGNITVAGETISSQTGNGQEYYSHIGADKTVELFSDDGDITIQ
jgi:uncharacterized membrane protein